MSDGPEVPVQPGPVDAGDRRGAVAPGSSEVTRLLCQAVHTRPDRVEGVQQW
ncbi:hypothetical protein ACFVIB_09710 [Streptomyces nigra]